MNLFGFDSETRLSQPGLAAPPMICVSIAGAHAVSLLGKAEGLAWLRERLLCKTDHIVGTNIAYDLVCAAAEDQTFVDLVFAALDEGRIHDIAIREALIDIGKGQLVEADSDGLGVRYGMALLAERYLSMDLSAEKGADSWRTRYHELEHLPIEQWPWEARRYPMLDAAIPREICMRQKGGQNLHDEPNQVRAAFVLQLMSVWGLRTNLKTVGALRARVVAEDEKSTREFQTIGIIRPEGTENKKLLQELVTTAYLGDPPKTPASKRFPHGQVATDRDTLQESGSDVLERYGRAGKNDKYLTTYLPIMEQGTRVPWNPQFNVLVATTRVSSNAQQFPQKGGVRECMEARPETVICSVDFGGGELRTMSQQAIWEVGFSDMAEALNGGKDAHLIAAASFMGTTYDAVKPRYKSGEEMVKNFRDAGKVWNFGKGGGMGPAAMVYNSRKGSKGETTVGPDGKVYHGIRFCLLLKQAERCGERKVTAKVEHKERRICAKCLEIAKQLDAGWLRAWREQALRFQKAGRMTDGHRVAVAKIPVVNILRGRCGYTQLLNTPFQGLLAAATKRAMYLVSREMHTVRSSSLWDSHLLLQVHDELIAELKRPNASRGGDRMAFLMRETLKEFVPDLAPSVEADPALSFTMAKEAKTVRDEWGALMIWTPSGPVAA